MSKSKDTDQEVKKLLRKTKKRLDELNQGDTTDAFALIEDIVTSQALSDLASQMAEDAQNPPTDAQGRPVTEWPTDAATQQRVISYILIRLHNTEVALYNTASLLSTALQIGLFLGTGKRHGIFSGSGANSAILPLLLLNMNGSGFSLFGTARNVAIKVWNGVFGR